MSRSMYPVLAERSSVSSSLIIWSSFICSSTAHLTACITIICLIYITHIRLVQTDKTVVAENSINQDHLLNYWAQKLFLLNLEMHTQSHPGYSSYLHGLRIRNRQSVPKRRHIQFRHRGITQKKE